MSYPGVFAQKTPDKPAVIMAGSGETVTYRQLDDRSNRLAQLFWDRGLRPGDHVAVFMENNARYHEAVWATLRSGLYLTTINSHLTAPEVDYILGDCEAQVLVTSQALRDVAAQLVPVMPKVHTRLVAGGAIEGYEDLDEAVAPMPAEPLDEELEG